MITNNDFGQVDSVPEPTTAEKQDLHFSKLEQERTGCCQDLVSKLKTLDTITCFHFHGIVLLYLMIQFITKIITTTYGCVALTSGHRKTFHDEINFQITSLSRAFLALYYWGGFHPPPENNVTVELGQ